MKLKKYIQLGMFLWSALGLNAQNIPASSTPPMGFMTWNYFGDKITENDVKTLTDAMVSSGLRDLGYDFIFIDDGWQGGRDAKNNIIADAKKFPSGLKALTDYVHSKGMKIGIYSDAAPLTCAGYTASLHFEEQDAKAFADWGFDYLKYDYCGAPADWKTAIERYSKMSQALQKSGRNIVFSICEWGDREPWLWAKKSGGQLWRTTADVRDKWFSGTLPKVPGDLHGSGAGILDIVNINGGLHAYAGPGGWNDPDMLVVGLYGKKGAPSSDLGGKGCTDIEYQSQMSLWCMMAAPLMITCDVRTMNEATRNILTNKEIIAIDQDKLGIQAERKINNSEFQVFVKPLENGDVALAILNISDQTKTIELDLASLGIVEKAKGVEVWTKEKIGYKSKMKFSVASHQTKVYRFSK